MPRYRQPYEPPCRFQQRLVRRLLHLRAFGLLRSEYIGLCGARSGYSERVLVAESFREWATTAVAEFVCRFTRAVVGTWPDWLPPQKPIFEVWDYEQEYESV